ncbi:phosphotransferase [Bacillus sp. DX1.1]|uniref:phosphotransferase n=1 Tax=unclassified Bacillus (in: firmicutes) TaxID=185979 RepID=UPI0025712598|nr:MULTISPECIES: phosphotransferase [unclassified Bacillus (in: firmicutes)]MDM5154776.1 phosphotransferase [Bacillus sp. DX1.1]WJE83656.1 phosphotransferase [Bacillus sp. DX3.1]
MDFHPENIILANHGPIVIDWSTVGGGDPFADVARTVVILRHAVLPKSMPSSLKEGIHSLRNEFCNEYIAQYLHLSKGTWQDIKQWILPVMAARLTEGIPDEEKDILYLEICKFI